MIRLRWAMMTIAAASLPCHAAAQQGRGSSSVETRGPTVEAHRSALQARIGALRAALRDTLEANAPDLVPTLDPAPPPVRQGYRLLPRIIPDAPQTDAVGLIVSTYSWPRTDSLIDDGSRRIDILVTATERPAKVRADYQRLVTDFNAIVAHRRLIDSHVEHNWTWQRAAVADPARFATATKTIDGALAGATPATPVPGVPRVEIHLEDTGPGPRTFRVPIVTDIEDTAFLRTARLAIETLWRADNYRVVLDLRVIPPAVLYCGAATATCAPGAGAQIDMPAHLARFPAGTAVLTTGATQPQVIGGRALVLGPRDIAPRTLGHEFGHVLGFDDAYLRGIRDLGNDGLAIVELIPGRGDVMSSPGFGGVGARHFTSLLANVRADRAMRRGLAAMYERSDPKAAAILFRETLAFRSDHYGATFQLAKALDQSGDSTAALPIWRRILDMATAQQDDATMKIARSRLGIP